MRRISSAIAVVAIVLSACGRVGDGPAAAPGGSPSGEPSGEGIRFVLEEEYAVGDRIAVRIENLGPKAYEYNSE